MITGDCKQAKTCPTGGAHKYARTKVASGLPNVADVTASKRKFIMHLSMSSPNGGEGGHTGAIDIDVLPVSGASEQLLTQGSPQGRDY